MATKNKVSDAEQVRAHIQKLDPPLKEAVEEIRSIILSCDKEIGERIKWNNPSFHFTGKMKPFDPKEYKSDIAVFNLHKGRIMLVFPTGATVTDESNLMEGNYKDGRRIIVFKDLAHIRSTKKDLETIIKNWIAGNKLKI